MVNGVGVDIPCFLTQLHMVDSFMLSVVLQFWQGNLQSIGGSCLCVGKYLEYELSVQFQLSDSVFTRSIETTTSLGMATTISFSTLNV